MTDSLTADRPDTAVSKGPVDPHFRESILGGLVSEQKYIESKWLYDQRGSHLFDAITELDEYYPTRVETGILRARANEIAELASSGSILLELGSGSSLKTRLLLDQMKNLAGYVPLDISADHLEATAKDLRADYPELTVFPVTGDFTQPVSLPASLADKEKILFFPGSTIGNFEAEAALELLRTLRRIENVTAFIVGIDLVKDEETLIRAYDDRKGVTAEFNLNLLTRINRELDGTFDLNAFRHEARWNAEESRIEMHLVSLARHSAQVAGETISFEKGETIHTENSHKYEKEKFRGLAAQTGWSVRVFWTDPKDYFALAVLT
ncbi:MAG: L-histidine N(alpha)-methyltransferase [Pseudomonadota bacterium]